jgi:hypothetical protein
MWSYCSQNGAFVPSELKRPHLKGGEDCVAMLPSRSGHNTTLIDIAGVSVMGNETQEGEISLFSSTPTPCLS